MKDCLGGFVTSQYEELFAAPGNKAISASTYLRVLMHVREGLVPFIANFMNFFATHLI